MAFKHLLSAVLLAVRFTGLATASPVDARSDQTTGLSQSSSIPNTDFYHPEVTYETYGDGIDVPGGVGNRTTQAATVSFLQHKLGVAEGQVGYKSGFSSEGGDFAYFHQVHNGIPFANAVANVALKDGKVTAFGTSFVNADKIADSNPTIDLNTATRNAEAHFQGTHDGHPPAIEYLVRPGGEVALTHSIQIQNETSALFVNAFVDAHNGEVLSAVDYVAHASYTAVPLWRQSVGNGGQAVLTNPANPNASPKGWHTAGGQTYTSTQGNNAVAYSGTNVVVQSSASQNFNYNYNTAQNPNQGTNTVASIVNAFAIVNQLHDVAYLYGFTEKAFNFQYENYGKGGAGNDHVLVSVQDKSGTNNAYFSTPPDGQNGRMAMFVFTLTNPNRDGAMDNGIIAHEFAHGVTNRMIGGGTARCLGATQSKGMGEGWGDIFSDWTEQTSAPIKDFVTGAYTVGNPKGIRHYPYSVNPKVNPLRYGSLTGLREEHDIGEIWANILHIILASLVDKYGLASDAFTNPNSQKGNVIFMHILFDSYLITPCKPTFIDARNAMIQAARQRYGAQTACLLWKAFASRGLGVKAQWANNRAIEDSTVPPQC